MNYQKHYNQLIVQSQLRILDKNVYVERHHILPRSMGGDNSAANIAVLTAREHFIAHYLLWKIHRNFSMGRAMLMMSDTRKTKGRTTSKTYELIRLQVNKLAVNRMANPKTREHLRNINLGHPVSVETRQKISAALTGKKQPQELIEKRTIGVKKYMSDCRIGKTWEEIYGKEVSEKMRLDISNANKGKILTNTHRENISKGNAGKILSDETKEKISASNKGKSRSKEARLRMSKSHLGKSLSDEQKKKISESNKGRVKSEETKKKMSDSKKGKVFTEEHKEKLREAAKNRKRLDKNPVDILPKSK